MPLRTLLLLAVSCLPCIAFAQSPPLIHVIEASQVEGDAGTTNMRFHIVLTSAATVPVTADFGVGSGSALAGEDFVDPGVVALSIPVGGHGTHVDVQIVGDTLSEGDEYFYVGIGNVVGAEVPWTMPVYKGTIIDNEPPPPVLARDDVEVVAVNAVEAGFFPTSNDWRNPGNEATLTIVEAPTHGTATVDGSMVRYVPALDYLGADLLRYRLCEGTDCDEAAVRIDVQLVDTPHVVYANVASGASLLHFDAWPALPGARFEATSLAVPEDRVWPLGTDPTPASPFDGEHGTAWELRTLAADGPERVLVWVDYVMGALADVSVGIDVDGDGKPSAAETCLANPCELVRPEGQALSYWLLVHNRGTSSADAYVRLYTIDTAPDGTLWATGPGQAPAREFNRVWIGIADDTAQPVDYRMGMITVRADADTVLGRVPVVVRYGQDTAPSPVPLVDDVPHLFALAPNSEHRSVFIDVPAGATRLEVTSESEGEVDLYLVKGIPDSDASNTRIWESNDTGWAVRSATGPGGDATLELTGDALTAGRWYVVPVNPSNDESLFTLTARIDADAPAVRSGSYFNAARSGHGLFLYPAGDQLTGVWYTYDLYGESTWYYLQAAAPDADGLWTSPLYRAAWDGDSHHLVAVGHATATPTGDDRFTFSYRLDGEAGSEPMAALGRGCPAGSGLDVSSTWYDPVRAGTGYSVQMFDDYEYFAAFYYDADGRPRFVAAERDTFGGAQATLIVQQLHGACPTCNYTAPARTDIGTLTRTIAEGTLTTVAADIAFAAPLDGDWITTDAVVPLGATQGCDP